VILAAGGGTRVRTLTSEKPKCLMDLGGRRIIDWILDALAAGGIRDVVMVTGYKAAVLERALGKAPAPHLQITYVRNRRWREPNGISLHVARHAVGDQSFLALMSDHLLPPGIIKKVARTRTPRCVLAVDTDIENIFDLSDATKVRIKDRMPEAIGKKLRTYNAVDCGLFRFDARIFTALGTAFRKGQMSLTAGVRKLIADGDLEVMPVGRGMTWIDIDTPKAYRHALRDLRRYLSASGRRKGKGT
jgi:choline kinase